jgi:hypothetical protein
MSFALGLLAGKMLRMGFSFISRRRTLRGLNAFPGHFSSLGPRERATLALAEHRRLLSWHGLTGKASDFSRIEACVLQYGQACADIARADMARRDDQ